MIAGPATFTLLLAGLKLGGSRCGSTGGIMFIAFSVRLGSAAQAHGHTVAERRVVKLGLNCLVTAGQVKCDLPVDGVARVDVLEKDTAAVPVDVQIGAAVRVELASSGVE